MRIETNRFKHVISAATVTVLAVVLLVRQTYAQDVSGALQGCTQTLSSLAQDADKTLDVLRQTNIKLNGPSYSLSEVIGLNSQNLYETGCTVSFCYDKMKADIRDKFRMSLEDFWSRNKL